jgi:hypothetical protein
MVTVCANRALVFVLLFQGNDGEGEHQSYCILFLIVDRVREFSSLVVPPHLSLSPSKQASLQA